MRPSTIIAALFFVSQFCYPQKNDPGSETIRDKECFRKLADGAIKSEMASFTIAGAYRSIVDSFPATNVIEVPFSECTGNSMTFNKGNIYSYDVLISVHAANFDTAGHKLTYLDSTRKFLLLIDDKVVFGTDGNVPRTKVESVSYLCGGKFTLHLPDSAIAGLYQPNFCSQEKAKDKPARVFCKVYRSADKNRIYIYMLNGDGAGGYEVTWVIERCKYITRVVDYAF